MKVATDSTKKRKGCCLHMYDRDLFGGECLLMKLLSSLQLLLLGQSPRNLRSSSSPRLQRLGFVLSKVPLNTLVQMVYLGSDLREQEWRECKAKTRMC